MRMKCLFVSVGDLQVVVENYGGFLGEKAFTGSFICTSEIMRSRDEVQRGEIEMTIHGQCRIETDSRGSGCSL